MILYISGPMTGLPELNFPAFMNAAAQLRESGFEVLNPAENEQPLDATWADFMRVDLAQVLQADGMAMLPGWLYSKGATLERHVALHLGLDIRDLNEWTRP